MRSTAAPDAPVGRRSISSLARPALNPYLDLLYRSLAKAGVPTGPVAALRLPWLLAHRREVRYLHFHWPEPLYRFERGPSGLWPALSWAKLVLFAARLRLARLLDYRIVWTVHQVYPHATTRRIDRVAARLLARHADLLVAHDPETAARARAELGGLTVRMAVVHHGSYTGVYPPGRARAEVRHALGIDDDAVVFLCFGELRANSEITTLLEAFAGLAAGGCALVIAGNAKDPGAGAAVARAAAADDRLVRIEGFVQPDGVRELYEAADVAVIPRSDGGTSGSLILALSLGTPVVVADAPSYRRLTGDGAAGWLFRGGDPADLRSALEHAAADPDARRERASAAGRAAEALDWSDAAARLASLLPP